MQINAVPRPPGFVHALVHADDPAELVSQVVPPATAAQFAARALAVDRRVVGSLDELVCMRGDRDQRERCRHEGRANCAQTAVGNPVRTNAEAGKAGPG